MHAGLKAFKDSLQGPAPPAGMTPYLQSVWLGMKGAWDQAHQIAQDLPGSDAAWIHAWLHRIEGDVPNARYWYGQAHRAASTDDTSAEGERIAAELLARSPQV